MDMKIDFQILQFSHVSIMLNLKYPKALMNQPINLRLINEKQITESEKSINEKGLDELIAKYIN